MSVGDDVQIDVFVGVDVGKSDHHAVALDRSGGVILDRPLPQDEARIVELINALKERGRVLFVVGQPATIGALPLAVARSCGVEAAICLFSRCVALRICILVKPRPTPATRR